MGQGKSIFYEDHETIEKKDLVNITSISGVGAKKIDLPMAMNKAYGTTLPKTILRILNNAMATLTYLDLESAGIGLPQDDERKLLELLAKMENLKWLCLGGLRGFSYLNLEFAEKGCSLFDCKTLRYLDLHSTDFKNPFLTSMLESMPKKERSILTLDLSSNSINDCDALGMLGELFPKLCRLYMCNNPLISVKNICLKQLHELDISFCKVEKVCPVLDLQQLRSLSIGGLKGCTDLEEFFSRIQELSDLSIFNVGRIKISEDETLALFSGLLMLPKLARFRCPILSSTKSELLSLEQFVLKNRFLHILDLRDVDFKPDLVEKLAATLEKQPILWLEVPNHWELSQSLQSRTAMKFTSLDVVRSVQLLICARVLLLEPKPWLF